MELNHCWPELLTVWDNFLWQRRETKMRNMLRILTDTYYVCLDLNNWMDVKVCAFFGSDRLDRCERGTVRGLVDWMGAKGGTVHGSRNWRGAKGSTYRALQRTEPNEPQTYPVHMTPFKNSIGLLWCFFFNRKHQLAASRWKIGYNSSSSSAPAWFQWFCVDGTGINISASVSPLLRSSQFGVDRMWGKTVKLASKPRRCGSFRQSSFHALSYNAPSFENHIVETWRARSAWPWCSRFHTVSSSKAATLHSEGSTEHQRFGGWCQCYVCRLAWSSDMLAVYRLQSSVPKQKRNQLLRMPRVGMWYSMGVDKKRKSSFSSRCEWKARTVVGGRGGERACYVIPDLNYD